MTMLAVQENGVFIWTNGAKCNLANSPNKMRALVG